MDEITRALNAQAASGLRTTPWMQRAANLLRTPNVPPITEAAAAPTGPVAPDTARPFGANSAASRVGGLGAGFTYGTANPGTSLPGGSPNVPAGGMSAEAAKYLTSRNAPVPPAAPLPASTGSSGLRAVGAGLSKAAGPLAIAGGAYNAVEGAREGDVGRAGLGALDAAAGAALFTPAAPAAGVYLGGRAAYTGGQYAGDRIRNNLDESSQDAIGGTINEIMQRTGLGGTSDTAYALLRAQRAAESRSPAQTATATAAPPVAPSRAVNGGQYTARELLALGQQNGAALPPAAQLAAPAPAPARVIFGDPNSEYNRQVRDGEIADSSGNIRRRDNTDQFGLRAPNIGRTDLYGGRLTAAQLHALGQHEQTGVHLQLGTEQNRINADNNLRTNLTQRAESDRRNQQALSAQAFDREKLLIDQFNKDRQFGLDTDKFGQQQSQDAFTSSIAGSEALHKQVLSSLPLVEGKNGPEPDVAGAAAYMTGANRAIAERVAELRARGDNAGAESLQAKGAAALGAQDKQDLTRGLAIKARFDKRNTQILGGARGASSSDPRDYLPVSLDPKNPRKVLLRGGMSMDLNDLTNQEMGNRFGLPTFFNPATTDLVGKLRENK